MVMLEHRYAHFEELVEIAGDDAKKAQTFQHRYVLGSRACARTRKLNSSAASSRLRKSSGWGDALGRVGWLGGEASAHSRLSTL
jgi:hypothetical protein